MKESHLNWVSRPSKETFGVRKDTAPGTRPWAGQGENKALKQSCGILL